MTTNCDLCGHTTVPDMVVVAWIVIDDVPIEIMWLCHACAIIHGWNKHEGTECLATFEQMENRMKERWQTGYDNSRRAIS